MSKSIDAGAPFLAAQSAESGSDRSPLACSVPISGARDRRPAVDQLVKDARRRRVDVLVCWRLDRLGRNLKHLVTLLDELAALGVAFVSLQVYVVKPIQTNELVS